MPSVPPRASPENEPAVSALRAASVPAKSASPDPGAFRVVSHEALFAAKHEMRCDACGAVLGEQDDEDSYGIEGRGVYLWARGDQVTLEDAPLCASCASAIGMTALARWEIEEEEG
jgi:hypothetical protein